MDLKSSEELSSLLFAPDYLPDILSWLRKKNGIGKVQTPKELTAILNISSWTCWNLFLRALPSPTQLFEEEFRSCEYKLLTDTGIADIERVRLSGNNTYQHNLIVRKDIQGMIPKIDLEQLKEMKSRRILVHTYAVAAANVYGAIDAETFIEMFNQYIKEPNGDLERILNPNKSALTRAELVNVLTPYTEINVDVLLIDGKLVNRMIWNGRENDIVNFIGKTYRGSYKSLSKYELLLYINKEYYKRTPEVVSFQRLFSEKVQLSSKARLESCFLIFSPCYLAEWKEIIECEICSLLKNFNNDDLQTIAESFIDAKNSLPCWEYKGFSKGEALEGSGLEEVEKEIDVNKFLDIIRK